MPYYFYVTNQISKLEWLIMWLLFIEGQMFQDAHSQIKLEKKVLLKFAAWMLLSLKKIK